LESCFFCLRHSTKIILHSAKLLPRVTLDKHFIDKKFFAEYFFRTLEKNFAECRKTLSKLIIAKNPKQIPKDFLNYVNNSPTTIHYHTHRPIIFHYYFESNLHVLWMVRFKPARSLSRIHSSTTTLLHQLCLYTTFSFLMYYKKPRVNSFENVTNYKVA
jgi:hypothetical protein